MSEPSTELAVTDVAEISASVGALALPHDEGTADRWSLRRCTEAWLYSKRSVHTRRAYFRDLSAYLTWCAAGGIDPRYALRGDIDMYAAQLRASGVSDATLARQLSALSSWYKYALSNQAVNRNPVLAIDRPHVDQDFSPTVGLTGAEVGEFMRTARASTAPKAIRDTALLGFMAELVMRVSEVLAMDMDDLRANRGHRTVRVVGKGRRQRELPIPVQLGRDLDAWLAVRGNAPGPVFTTATGRRVGHKEVFLLVRRIADLAGLPAAALLSPHSLRHTGITAALDAGAPLRDVQDFAGHADSRTTRRYDRSRGNLDRSPAYLIAHLFAE